MFGMFIALAVAVLVAVTVVIFHRAPLQSKNTSNTKELVQTVMEEPMQCLLDEECTSYSFATHTDEVTKIKQVFNAYDGDDDDLWTKQEFVQFYSEAAMLDSDPWSVMDLNGDSIWSYKEAVIYMMKISEISNVRDVLYPMYTELVADIYNYTSTEYDDQLFWEYAAEIVFVQMDEYQQGFVTKDAYFGQMASAQFDMFAHSDPNHATIAFDEFLGSRLSQQAMNDYVNTDLDALSAEYDHLGMVFAETGADDLLANLQLKHCLYSTVDFENVRRRLSSKSACINNVVGCTGATVATVAGCVLGASTGWGIVACAGGVAVTGSSRYSAYSTCDSYLRANG